MWWWKYILKLSILIIKKFKMDKFVRLISGKLIKLWINRSSNRVVVGVREGR